MCDLKLVLLETNELLRFQTGGAGAGMGSREGALVF